RVNCWLAPRPRYLILIENSSKTETFRIEQCASNLLKIRASPRVVAAGYELLCLPAEFEPDRRCSTSIGWTDPPKTARSRERCQRILSSSGSFRQFSLGRHTRGSLDQPVRAGGGSCAPADSLELEEDPARVSLRD